jgi:Domain of unknown function (DUF4340)
MDKRIILGAVILAALGAAVFYRNKSDDAVGKATTTSADMPDVKAPEDVDKVVIVNADKGEVTLEKKADKWEVVKPVAFAANQANVKSLIDNMKELKASETISSNLTDDQKKLYELDAAKGVHVTAFKGADKKVDLVFGKSGGRGQMSSVDGKPGVYAISGYSSYLYTREVKAWRDQEMLKFDDANANQVTITNKNGVFSFTKGDKWAGSFKDKPIARFDDSKVGDLLRAVKGLNADDFGDGKSPAETGLDAPEGVVTVSLKDNAGKYTLKVGKVASGTNRYAQKDGSNTVYVISNWPSEWALAEPSKFQRPADAGAPKDGGPAKLEMPDMQGMPPGMMPHGMPGMPEGHP